MVNERTRVTFHVSKDIINRMKNCVWWERDTMAAFAERALLREIKRAEKGNGKPFEQRKGKIKTGRPIS